MIRARLLPVFLFALLLTPFAAQGAETSRPEPAQPAAPEATAPESLPEENAALPDVQAPVVLELFTSQACAFCPKADALLGDLSSMKNVIAMSCHVDYFDLGKGSLTRPFCAKRQTAYANTLRSGPVYTPQMVIDGEYETVGYRLEKISQGLRKVASPGVAAIGVVQIGEPARYKISFPELEIPKTQTPQTAQAGVYDVWIAMLDKPRDENGELLKDGAKAHYYNVISDLFSLGPWDGHERTMVADVKTLSRHQAFVALAQKPGGEILAAGKLSLEPAASEQAAPAPEKAVESIADDDAEWMELFGWFED